MSPLAPGDVVPICVEAWMIRDGAEPFPEVGDEVAWALEADIGLEEPAYTVPVCVVVEPRRPHSDGRVRAMLRFGEFDARGLAPESMIGTTETSVRFRLAYWTGNHAGRRLHGQVTRVRMLTSFGTIIDRRRLPTRTELTDVSALGRRPFQDTGLPTVGVYEDGTWEFLPEPDTWSHDIGLLVDVRIGEPTT